MTAVAERTRPAATAAPPASVLPGARDGIGLGSGLDGWPLRMVMVALALGGGGAVGVTVAIKAKYGVMVVVAIALGLVVLRRLEVGALALVSLVPILSGVRRGWPLPSLRLSEILTAAVAAAVFTLIRKSRVLPWTRVEWLMASFCVGGIALGLFDAHRLGQHMTIQQYGTLVGPVQFFLLFRSIRLALHSARWRLLGLRLLILSSVPVSLLAILQQADVPKVRSFVFTMTGSDVLVGNASGYQSFARATGPFPHWTPLAGYLTVILVVCLGVMLETACRPLPRRWLYAVALLDAVGLAFTAELSAIIGLVIALFILGRSFGRLKRVLQVAAIAFVGVAIVAGPYVASRVHNEYVKAAGTDRNALVPQTIEFRMNIWEHQYFPAIGERPIVGFGMVNPSMVDWPATESQYVTILERGGVVLMVLYLALMGGLLTAGLAVARGSDDPLCRVTGYSVAALVVILVPMNAIFPYLEDSGLPQALWALVGIMLAGVRSPLPSIATLQAAGRRLRL